MLLWILGGALVLCTWGWGRRGKDWCCLYVSRSHLRARFQHYGILSSLRLACQPSFLSVTHLITRSSNSSRYNSIPKEKCFGYWPSSFFPSSTLIHWVYKKMLVLFVVTIYKGGFLWMSSVRRELHWTQNYMETISTSLKELCAHNCDNCVDGCEDEIMWELQKKQWTTVLISFDQWDTDYENVLIIKILKVHVHLSSTSWNEWVMKQHPTP